MGLYKYLSKIWKKPKETNKEAYKAKLMKWRREPVTVRIVRPTRVDRARTLGYKAKEGFIVIRQKVKRGGHRRPDIKAGRKPRRFGVRKNLKISYQVIAEQRAAKKHVNLEVLGSYWVGQDSHYYWHEVILVDPLHPVIRADKQINWISEKQHTKRVFRGLTSAGRKSRGLLNKSKGAEKIRPSLRANHKRGN